MILRTLHVGPLQTNCYLVACSQTHHAMVIDPGGDEPKILAQIQQLGVQLDTIILTHFHFDHAAAAAPLRKATNARLAMHGLDAEALKNPPALFRLFAPDVPRGVVADDLFQDEESFSVGELAIQVLFTPGHSPGGISLYIASEKLVFSGDALFREGIGRTDFPGSSYERLIESIEQRLFALPDETVVYPGHGPSTTIGHERNHNLWVRRMAS
jgi:hydroxyacylglutathione hydrolase